MLSFDPQHTRRLEAVAERLLHASDVHGQLPTPVDAIVATAGLHRGDDSIFEEGKLARAPDDLQRVVRRLTGRVRAMLDRREREIYVHPDIHLVGRRNFQTLHEVGHDVLPWQSALAYADDDLRLSWATRIGFEREANYLAAELLFQRELFASMAADYSIGFAPIIELCQRIGASIHAATRRYVETHTAPLCGVVLTVEPKSQAPLRYRRLETFCSSRWAVQFATPDQWPSCLSEREYPFVSDINRLTLLPSVSGEWVADDRAGASIKLRYELFSNTYSVFALTWIRQREWAKRRRSLTDRR